MNKKIYTAFLLIGSSNLIADGIKKEQIARFLPADPIIIEAGAHIGTDTAEMARRWPQAKVYAFEPVPWLFKVLRTKTKHYKNVFRFKEALSSRTGTAVFYVSSGTSNGSGSLLPPHEHLLCNPTVFFNRTIEVPTITLNEWAQRQDVSHIDFMWLDMQGFELDMLKAVSPALLATVQAIHIEVSLRELYKGCPLYPEVRDWLEKRGFYVEMEVIRPFDGDVLFVRRVTQ